MTNHKTTNLNDKNYPDAVASDNAQSGNEVGLFYQSQAPHGVQHLTTTVFITNLV